MNCVVIDDEPLARKGMEMLIAQVPQLRLTGTFSSIAEARPTLRSPDTHLVFLDIHMPTENGLTFLKGEGTGAKVIITTAYPQFAVDAFELEVVDYLVKPIRVERFRKAVSRVSQQRQQMVAEDDDDYIFIRTERKYVRARYADIDYVEGLKDYVIIYCNGEKHTVASNLKTVHETLPPAYFIRINKSFVVNMSRVTTIDNESVSLGSKRLPIGDNYRKAVLEFVNARKVIRRQL